MPFSLPEFEPPDFTRAPLNEAPPATLVPAPLDGVAPDNFHATTIYPEYFHHGGGKWSLLQRPRMDCVAVRRKQGHFEAVEFRNLKKGDLVVVGRDESGGNGILVHTNGFHQFAPDREKFAFRTGLTRETSFSIDYDFLYELLRFERDNGFILWVLGPAVVFDSDARKAFSRIIANGYVHGMLAGNALATHDLEGALMGTALGLEIYTKRPAKLGHYNHLETLNRIRAAGSIRDAVNAGMVRDGVMRELIRNDVPFVLAGSIRDDGPMPEVLADVYTAQDRMRDLASRATTVITMATQLHTIATGNMTPSYHVRDDGSIRPVYFFSVDMSEFAVGKLADRGSLTAKAILTNVQDFAVTLDRALSRDST
jgi:lysine-ketoglutarate reductase/saccharopine dehydrogenase-like protein (TIGR00300 family)